MVNGEQSRSQRIFGLPFTVYCSPHALRSALSALRHESGPLRSDSLIHHRLGFEMGREWIDDGVDLSLEDFF